MNADDEIRASAQAGASRTFFGTKNLFTQVEGRRALVIYSDIPQKIERVAYNGIESERSILAYYDFNRSSIEIEGSIKNLVFEQDWTMNENIQIGSQVLDNTRNSGFALTILKSTIPSLNIHPMINMRYWDYSDEKFIRKEIPVLENDTDSLVIRLILVPKI